MDPHAHRGGVWPIKGVAAARGTKGLCLASIAGPDYLPILAGIGGRERSRKPGRSRVLGLGLIASYLALMNQV